MAGNFKSWQTYLVVLVLVLVGLAEFSDGQRSQRRRQSQVRTFGYSSIRPVRQSNQIRCEESAEDRKHWQSKCTCPKIYAPVCASDNVTYHNRCFLECKIKHQYFRYRAPNLRLKKMEPCEGGIHDTSFSLI